MPALLNTAKKVEKIFFLGYIILYAKEMNEMTEQITAVQKMQEYIEANLDSDITMADLARVSCFSPWHAYRLFKNLTGFTPAEYIRRLRLSRSAMKLKNEGCRITDAAFEFGFGSVDGYTRSFYREFGCNPGEYAKSPVPVSLFIPYGVKFRELRKEKIKMKDLQNVFIQVIKRPERRAIVKRGVRAKGYFDYCGEVGCDVWGLLMSMDSICGEPAGMWLPDRYREPDTSVYVQGIEVAADYDGIVPEGFDVITLPEAEFLMFQTEPFAEENYMQVITNLEAAMDRYDPSVIGYEWDSDNPRIQLEPKGERGYIEMKAVKRIK